MSSFYDEQHRALQDEFDSRQLADVLEAVIVRPEINHEAKAFIESRSFFFLSTVNSEGHPTVSHKGGAAGFVRVIDRSTIVFPSYDGNGMFLSVGNVAVNPHVGLLFIDFRARRPSRLRVNGIASIDERDPLRAAYPGAQLVVRVHATQVFPNCPRYIHRMKLVERSRFVPRADAEPPVPDWKRAEWACDVLPEGDPATS